MTRRDVKVGALPYYGGKSPSSSNRTGPWIAHLLGEPKRGEMYLEPFAGMLGVLLSRAPADAELMFDLDDRIVTWWKFLQERPAELNHIIETTPHSATVFKQAIAVVATPCDHSDIEVAKSVSVLLTQGVVNSLHKPLFSRWKGTRGSSFRCFIGDRLLAVYERIKDVVFDVRPASETLVWSAPMSHAVVYCDPPYTAADTSPYAFDADHGALTGLLQSQAGKAAISGYGAEWDHLGWLRHERSVRAHAGSLHSKAPERVEVLWTNFEPTPDPQPQLPDI